MDWYLRDRVDGEGGKSAKFASRDRNERRELDGEGIVQGLDCSSEEKSKVSLCLTEY